MCRDSDAMTTYINSHGHWRISEKARAGKLKAVEMRAVRLPSRAWAASAARRSSHHQRAEVAILGVAKSSLKPVYDWASYRA